MYYVKLIRLNNWVKNAMIFLPAFFSGNLFEMARFTDLVFEVKVLQNNITNLK